MTTQPSDNDSPPPPSTAITVRLPVDLHDEAKIIAAAAEISVNQLVCDSLRDALDRYHRDTDFRTRLQANMTKHRRLLDRLAAT